MSKKYQTAVVIGRFQPFHIGHKHMIDEALKIAENVIVAVGDTGGAPQPKNPYPVCVRVQMIEDAYDWEEASRLSFISAKDNPSDAIWEAEIISQVDEVREEFGTLDYPVVLVGHKKDATSFYLDRFHDWDKHESGVAVGDAGEPVVIDATDIRHLIYEGKLAYTKSVLPAAVYDGIAEDIRERPQFYADMAEWVQMVRKYRKPYEALPFPPIFVTVDVMVVSGPYVLLIKRGQNPGKGLWALPGGFLDQSETIEDAALRELEEETQIKLQREVLRSRIKAVRVFDRAGGVTADDRGRIVTHTHLIVLDPNRPPPPVKGSDDACEAVWMNLGGIDPRIMFSDHGPMIESMKGLLV